MIVKILSPQQPHPVAKLAEAELHFTAGPLQGLRLVGFAVWSRHDGGPYVTFPARTYQSNGETHSYVLLRPAGDMTGQERLRDVILKAYAEFEAQDDNIRPVEVLTEKAGR